MTPTQSPPLTQRLSDLAREAFDNAFKRTPPAPALAALLGQLERRGVPLTRSHALLMCCPSATSELARTLSTTVARVTVWERRRAARCVLAELAAGAPSLQIEAVDPQAAADYGAIYGPGPEADLGPFDVIVVGSAEHQTLFPGILRLLARSAVLIVSTEPVLAEQPPQGGNAASFDDARLTRRRAFYDVRDPLRLTVPQLAGAYVRCAVEQGFAPEWYVGQPDEDRFLIALKLAQLVL